MATSRVHAPSSNTSAIVTIAASATGAWHEIEGIYWSYDAAPTGGSLLVESPSGTTLLSLSITAAGPGFLPFSGSCLRGATSQAMIITLAAGGSGVTGKINVQQRSG